MTTAVQFTEVSRHYGEVKAVDRVSIEIRDGEFFSMLGPSGSGKTTCLRLIAGFEQPSSGSIRIHGQEAAGLPPYERDVNTVFQDYALFPHMNVLDNVAYGLKVKGVAKAERLKRAEEALDMVALATYGSRKPAQLSGGQRQRVALARALVNRPRVLLLDEPLGALDLKLREQMQVELKKLQRQLGITFIFVTHDQGEALAMSDRVVVMNKGRIEQMGSPFDVYEYPQTEFVAGFLGNANFLQATVVAMQGDAVQVRLAGGANLLVGGGHARPVAPGDAVKVVVRAEKVVVTPECTVPIMARIVDVDYLGALARYEVELAGGQRLRALSSLHEKARSLGETVGVGIDPEHCRIL